MTEPAATWLPNLVGGVSIWKLARDLNAPHLFDGRLLVPDAEGADSLPTRVTWNLGGLVPLVEARASAPAEVAAATTDFLARLDRVGQELGDPASGFHRFKDAFTVPGLETDGGSHYFFDPRGKKLCVINWGASPRAIAGAQSLVFGWQSFDKVGGAAAIAGAAAAGAAVAGASTATAPPEAVAPEAAAAAVDAERKEEKKKDEKKVAAPALLWGRPWWHWLLALLAAAAIVALVLYLLHACNEPLGGSGADAGAGSEAGAAVEGGARDGSDATLDGDGGSQDGTSESAIDAAGEGSADGATDGSADGSADGATEGSSDATTDGASDAKSDSKIDGAGSLGAGNGGVGSGVGVGVGPGGVLVPGHDPNALPHRFHFEPEATRWRVTAGQNMLDPSSPVEGLGQNFEVILKPGGSFDGVKVQWQDASGRWHQ